MRIGIDARFYGSLGKGLGRYTEKLIEHLEQIDQENEYIIFLRQENFSEYVPKNPHFKKKVAQYAWYGFAEQVFFVLMLYRASLDLVHFPHFNVPILYRRKFVVTIHDLILVHYPTLRNTTRFAFLYFVKFLVYRFVIASAIKCACHIVTVSEFTKCDIAKEYPVAKGKMTVTYEAADSFCQFMSPEAEEQFLARMGLLQQPDQKKTVRTYRDIIEPYFLYVGNAYPHKNLPLLFAAARAFPQYRLLLVGKEDFFYTRLQREAQAAGLTNVVFVGFLTDAELSILYHHARVYIFPSLYEGFGLPPLEAMARGAVVVSSDRGSLPEVLGEAALFFDPTDAQALLATLRRLEAEPEMVHTLRERGYQQVNKYHFRTMALQTYEIYQNINTNKI